MSAWQAPRKPRAERPLLLQELAIFFAGALVAVLAGIAASGVLPA
jgi:hypothetical protein